MSRVTVCLVTPIESAASSTERRLSCFSETIYLNILSIWKIFQTILSQSGFSVPRETAAGRMRSLFPHSLPTTVARVRQPHTSQRTMRKTLTTKRGARHDHPSHLRSDQHRRARCLRSLQGHQGRPKCPLHSLSRQREFRPVRHQSVPAGRPAHLCGRHRLPLRH